MIITLTTDFGNQVHGIGAMKLVIYKINPDAKIVDYAHGLSDFDIVSASRTMECLRFSQPSINVCVVDPGVGTERKGVVIETNTGHFFIGPDNGVFTSACRLMDGIKRAHVLSNQKLMNDTVSHIFHGRDVFAPAAAHISKGVDISEFGEPVSNLFEAPYDEAKNVGGSLEAEVIAINKFQSLHLNILWDAFDIFRQNLKSNVINVKIGSQDIRFKLVDTFGEVDIGHKVILKDDFGRVQLAVNRGNLNKELGLNIGSKVILRNICD